MALPGVIERPEVHDSNTASGANWIVTVYDNDYNSFDEVIMILVVATGCALEEAEMEAWEIDRLGRSVVHYGSMEECLCAAEIIAQIGIRVEVSEE